MKKTLLLTLALLFSVTLFSQSVGTIVKEAFDSDEMPEGWKITGNNPQNWSVSQSNLCGGDANEMKLSWQPTFYNGFTRLTSPTLDLTGVDSILVSFKHYVDIYTTYPSKIGIATSSSNGMKWDKSYEETFYADGQHHISKVIANEDMGKDKVMVALFYEGNSGNLNAIYFDDVEINTIETINAKVASIDIPNNIGSGNTDVTFSVQNLGSETITSFEAEYVIGEERYSHTFETEIAFIETKQFTFDKAINLNPGNTSVEVNISSINNKEDKDMRNNTLTKEIGVALGSTQRYPMIEHFSSSTCSYCVSVDNSMQQLTSNNPGKYTYVKYPLNFPAPGDPYNTEECNMKKEFYEVTAAPNVVLDGFNYRSTSLSQYQLDESYNSSSFVNIEGAFNIENNTINVTADVMSYVDLENVKAFVAVNEKTTKDNVGTNGLTEFHHIMMKMLDDVNGNDINLKAGESQRLEFTYDMNSTFVEDMNDLEVAVWIQSLSTKEVFNSKYLYEYTEHPYPVQNLTVVVEDEMQISWEAPEKGTASGYNLYINNELTLTNTKETSYSTEKADDYLVEVVALYGDKTSVGVVKTSLLGNDENENENEDENGNGNDTTNVISNYENRFVIYPNPVEDELFLATEVEVEEITIYDIYGRLCRDASNASISNASTSNTSKSNTMDTFNVSVQDLKAGIYFVKVKTNDGETVKRFIKN